MDIKEIIARRDWENPAVFQRHRLPRHVPLFSFASVEDAVQVDHPGRRTYLNGTWKFRLLPAPVDLDSSMIAGDIEDEKWANIYVPMNWECQGFSQPRYTNKQYPFSCCPPQVPEDNPTGCYRLRFQAYPKADEQTRIYFDGFASALMLWCNGTFIGYAQDGRVGAAFDLSKALIPGDNDLCVVVLRWCDGSYLEDQDMWSLSGLFRDVYLLYKPCICIEDFSIHPQLSEDYQQAQIRIEVQLSASAVHGAFAIEAKCLDAQGKLVTECKQNVTASESVTLQLALTNVHLWSDETPYLYQFILSLTDVSSGQIIDIEKSAVGLREIALKDQLICLNGRPVLFRGVNRHEFHPQRGYTVTEQDMLADIRLLKQGNFNAVRTAHYPNHPRWYTLCDRLGVLLIDEANIETHGMQPMHALLDDPAWLPACQDRVLGMVALHKNHPSVLIWSLGNESGYGRNHDVLYQWLKQTDLQRLVQYEGGGADTAVTDIICPMYARVDEKTQDETGIKWPIVDWIDRLGESRPLVLCEYAHAMGNSLGGFGRYWRAFRAHERLQGGFLWDWQDQGLAHPHFPQDAWAYGGDFADTAHDQQFCLNGILFPDKTPHPAYFEAKYHQQYLWGTLKNIEPVTVSIDSEYQYQAIKVCLQWQYLVDYVPLDQGQQQITLPPQTQTDVVLSACQHIPKAGHIYHLTCEVLLIEATPWAPVHHPIAKWQLALPAPPIQSKPKPIAEAKSGRSGWKFTETSIFYQDWQIFYTQETGRLMRIEKAGKGVLLAPLTEHFFRAPVDNDYAWCERGKMHPQAWLKRWQDAGLDRLRARPLHVHCCAAKQEIYAVYGSYFHQNLQIRTHWHYQFLADGLCQITIEFFIAPHLPPLPRLGVMTVLSDCQHVSWKGRGPHENYPDRCDAALLGSYELPMTSLYTPYIFPSENGLRTGVRALTCGAFCVESKHDFCFSVQPYSPMQLFRATHAHQLFPELGVTLCLDRCHAGLGGDDSWSPSIHPEQQITDKYLQWKFCLKLV